MLTGRRLTARDFASLTVRHTEDAMGATHFLMKTLPKVATEMALHVLALGRADARRAPGAGTEDDNVEFLGEASVRD